MVQCNGINSTEPLVRGRRTRQACTNHLDIKVMAVRLEGIFIVGIAGGEQNWVIRATAELQNSHRFLGNWQERVLSPGILLVTSSRTTSRRRNRAPHQTPTMPRLRGTPRRGAAWYAAKSRRKRKQTFEAALAIARRRRKAKPHTPPMAYVVEEIPEGGIPDSIPEHLLFTVPENWNPSTDLGQGRQTSSVGEKVALKGDDTEGPQFTCYIEEELPSAACGEATMDTPPGGDRDSTKSYSQERPPSPSWERLNLIFEIRSALDDQTFRLTRIEQRLNMYFAAHSRTHPRRQCPTCARPYAFPAGWKQTEEQHQCAG